MNYNFENVSYIDDSKKLFLSSQVKTSIAFSFKILDNEYIQNQATIKKSPEDFQLLFKFYSKSFFINSLKLVHTKQAVADSVCEPFFENGDTELNDSIILMSTPIQTDNKLRT